MKELKDLVEYANPIRLRRLAFFRRRGGRSRTQAQKLYEAIARGEVADDHEASNYLFGRSSDPQYFKLKHQLRGQLQNTVMLIDGGQKARGEFYHGYVEARKLLYTAEVLWFVAHLKAAVGILKRLLKLAIRLELTDIVIPTLERLRNYTVTINPDLKQFESYQEQLDEWYGYFGAEASMSRLYQKVAIRYTISEAPPQMIEEIISEGLKEHYQKYQSAPTVNYQYWHHFLIVVQKMNRQEYEEGIEVCWQAIEIMRQKSFTPRAYFRLFLLQIIDMSLRFKGFTEGRRSVLEYLKIVDEGDGAWFRIYQLYFYLSIYSQETDSAVSISNRVFAHRKFRKLSPLNQERWFLLRAYLHWLIETGNVEPEKEVLHNFRLGRFLNNVPNFSKDKQGMNIPVLVIQSLWLLHQKRYTEARQRFESLERYGGRHLRNSNGLLRTHYFVKLISQLPKANFHRAGFQRRASRYLKELRKHPLPKDQQSVQVEVIPYERLYGYIVATLDEKLH